MGEEAESRFRLCFSQTSGQTTFQDATTTVQRIALSTYPGKKSSKGMEVLESQFFRSASWSNTLFFESFFEAGEVGLFGNGAHLFAPSLETGVEQDGEGFLMGGRERLALRRKGHNRGIDLWFGMKGARRNTKAETRGDKALDPNRQSAIGF